MAYHLYISKVISFLISFIPSLIILFYVIFGNQSNKKLQIYFSDVVFLLFKCEFPLFLSVIIVCLIYISVSIYMYIYITFYLQ